MSLKVLTVFLLINVKILIFNLKIQAYEPDQPRYKGLVYIELKNAFLERDVALLGTMNTCMKLIMDHQIYKSDVPDGSGKYGGRFCAVDATNLPIWYSH